MFHEDTTVHFKTTTGDFDMIRCKFKSPEVGREDYDGAMVPDKNNS